MYARMSGQKDYYRILGVSKDASRDEIKRSYRKLARQFHPDVNPGDGDAEERFKQIAEAYHVLSDKERRAAYDRGPEHFAQEFDLSDFLEQLNRAFGGSGAAGGIGLGGFGDLFSGIFGGQSGATSRTRASRGPQVARRGRDVEVALTLTFSEAVQGTEKSISYRRPSRCASCDGSGRQGAAVCFGCHGSGRVLKPARARVTIPAGVSDGARIRVAGRGEPGSSGGPPGDLYLEVGVQRHPIFERRASDLYVEVPVTVYEAALGGQIEVPTLEGTARINLPAGTRNGQVIRLMGKGGPSKGGPSKGRPSKGGPRKGGPRRQTAASGMGDLYVTVRIDLPDELDDEAVELLRRFEQEHPYNPRSRLVP